MALAQRQSVIFVSWLLAVVFVWSCDALPVPDSGPGIEIQPAEYSADGQLNYLVVGNKEAVPMNLRQPQAQPAQNVQSYQPQPQYQQQPPYQQQQQQPQYPSQQYLGPQPPYPSAFSRPAHHYQHLGPDEYISYGNQVPQDGFTGYTGGIGASALANRVIRPLSAGASLLGAALLFG